MSDPQDTFERLPKLGLVPSHDEYRMALDESWVAVSDRGYEVLSYDNGLAVETSAEVDIGGGFGMILDQVGITSGRYREEWNRQIICHDGKERTRLRRTFQRLLRPQQVAKLQGTVRELINGILDDIADPSDVDFMPQFADRLPTQLFCRLISAPLSLERDIFRITSAINPPILTFDIAGINASEAAYFEGLELMRRYIQARRSDLNDDFTSELIRCELEELIGPDEVEAVAMSLLMASMDNTMHQLGLTFGTLLEDRSRWEKVLAKPTATPKAAEETFRMCPRFNSIQRHTPHELPIDDFAFPADSWIQVATRACGRDASKFDDPDEFRMDRPASPALQFGSQQYSCLGATMARLEVSEALRIVGERYPGIQMIGGWEYEVGPLVTECKKLHVSLI